jgi:hypothetical protein
MIHAALIQKQVGWKKCVACSDSRLRPGMMWIGANNWIECPSCKGKKVVPRVKLYDPATGQEIDYEAPPAHN